LVVGAVGGYFYGTSAPGTTVTRTINQTTTGGGTVGTDAPQLAVLASDAAAARTECGSQATCLTVYSTVDGSDFTADMAPNFYQAFPWANGKVNWISTSASKVTAMAISEHQAGNVVGDLLVVTLGIVYPAILAGAVQNYTSPMGPLVNATVASGGADPHGAWYVSFISVPVIQYNPQQLQSLNLPTPKSWSDLGNPVYKGHIGFQTAVSLSATTGIFYYLFQQMGNSSWTSLMNAIAANQPVITSSASATTDNIVTGKVALGIGLYNDYLSAHATSPSTIGYVSPPPNVYNPGISALTKGSHQAMAKLMEDWLMSNAGAQAYAETSRLPSNQAVAAIFSLNPPGTTLVNSYSNPAILQNPNKWTALFKSIFGS
jgi:iron(III) transport system substrate-binding protein